MQKKSNLHSVSRSAMSSLVAALLAVNSGCADNKFSGSKESPPVAAKKTAAPGQNSPNELDANGNRVSAAGTGAVLPGALVPGASPTPGSGLIPMPGGTTPSSVTPGLVSTSTGAAPASASASDSGGGFPWWIVGAVVAGGAAIAILSNSGGSTTQSAGGALVIPPFGGSTAGCGDVGKRDVREISGGLATIDFSWSQHSKVAVTAVDKGNNQYQCQIMVVSTDGTALNSRSDDSKYVVLPHFGSKMTAAPGLREVPNSVSCSLFGGLVYYYVNGGEWFNRNALKPPSANPQYMNYGSLTSCWGRVTRNGRLTDEWYIADWVSQMYPEPVNSSQPAAVNVVPLSVGQEVQK